MPLKKKLVILPIISKTKFITGSGLTKFEIFFFDKHSFDFGGTSEN